MKQRHVMIACVIALVSLATGCSTGYRSEMIFSHLSGRKYKLNVKVIKITRTPFATSESDMCTFGDIIWEQGKPQTTTFGNDKTGVTVNAFVPTDDKSDIVYGVILKQNGDVKMSSNFKIRQETK